MKYIWTEDTGAGFYFWELANEHLFQGEFVVESKGSNQGILDAVRQLVPNEGDKYYFECGTWRLSCPIFLWKIRSKSGIIRIWEI